MTVRKCTWKLFWTWLEGIRSSQWNLWNLVGWNFRKRTIVRNEVSLNLTLENTRSCEKWTYTYNLGLTFDNIRPRVKLCWWPEFYLFETHTILWNENLTSERYPWKRENARSCEINLNFVYTVKTHDRAKWTWLEVPWKRINLWS